MSNPLPLYLPDLRRIVTTHNAQGIAVVQSDTLLHPESMEDVKGARGSSIWVTTDAIPTNENNIQLRVASKLHSLVTPLMCLDYREDGGKRKIDNVENLNLVHPTGTNLRSTDLAPGAITPMHRTSSLDYNILVSGELVLITEDGKEKLLKNPGDTVVQKGTLHAWRNPSSKNWARWLSILIAAEPAVVNGEQLNPEFRL